MTPSYRRGITLSDREIAAFRLSQTRQLRDHEIAEQLGITREWACKLRTRAARKLKLLNQLVATPGETLDVLERVAGQGQYAP